MHPEHELDALLSERSGRATEYASAEVVPLLEAARRLEAVGEAAPTPDFTRTLEEQLLARVDLLSARPTMTPAAHRHPSPAGGSAGRRTDLPAHRRWIGWQVAVAAALLLAIGSGATLRAAASAVPGSPLFGLRQVEQNVRVQLASSEAARARLHLQYASDDLRALDAAVGSDTYEAALAAFQAELRAASDAVARVPPGAAHDTVAGQLADLSARARQDMTAALPSLGWADRAATTAALGDLGMSVPRVTSATLVNEHSAGGSDWRITITGSGFEPGALLLLNGRPLAATVTVTPTELQAVVENPPNAHVGSLGIGNPDDTAALTTNLQLIGMDNGHGNGHGPNSTPGATPGNGKSGDQGKHGGQNGTATPSPTPAGHRP